jgi:hypothetical protein
MKRSVRVTIFGALSLAALFSLLAATVGVSFYRRVPLDNDPLTNSIAIVSVSSNRLTLADGRVLTMSNYHSELLSFDILKSGNRIELQASDSHFANVYVKRKRYFCGNGRPAVVIPVFRNEYPVYYRDLLGLGEFQ